MHFKYPVLILGTTENVFVDIARSLKKSNLPAILINHSKSRKWVSRTKLFDKIYTITNPIADPEIWLSDMISIGKKLYSKYSEKLLLIPSDDIDLGLFCSYELILSEFFTIPSYSNSVSISRFFDKSKVDKMLLDVEKPKSLVFSGSKSVLQKIDFSPILIKPVSRDATNQFSKDNGKFLIFPDKGALISFIEKIDLKYGPLFIQSFIKKTKSNEYSWIGYVGKNNQSKGLTVRKTRQIPIGAGTTFAEAIKISELESISNKIIRKLNFTGICEIEYLYSKEENKYYFLEFNARPCRWFYLAICADINLIEMQYRDLDYVNEANDYAIIPKKIVKWCDLRVDFYYHVLKKNDISGIFIVRFCKWFNSVIGSNLTFVTQSDLTLCKLELKRFLSNLIDFFIKRIDIKMSGEHDSKYLDKFQ